MSTSDNSTTTSTLPPYTKGDRVEYEGQQYTVSFAQESYITLRHDNGALPSSFRRNGKTSTQLTSDWFYNEVCRYFEEDQEAQQDLYKEVDILFLDDAHIMNATSNYMTQGYPH